jgi:hypothetical protein
MHKGDVVIRTPCGADWNAMDPRGRARLCRSCDKLVHDLSAMAENEAAQLLEQTPSSLCVRYLHDTTGKIWFRDDLTALVPRERLISRARKGALALAAVIAPPLLLQACGGADGSDWRYAATQQADGGVPPPRDPTASRELPGDEAPSDEAPSDEAPSDEIPERPEQ